MSPTIVQTNLDKSEDNKAQSRDTLPQVLKLSVTTSLAV
jgi:hypothetical protein